MRLNVDGREVYAYTGSRAFDSSCPTVVFVHGAANDHSVWALQSRYLAHHGRNVLALDLPGHGRSAGAPLASVEAIAHWIVLVLDAVGLARATLVGHSLGALAVLDSAAHASDRVERIALLGPAVPMVVSDALLEAARNNDHVAYELIVGWSHSAGKQLGGNQVPGLWMTGSALRLMERSAPNALAADLTACNAYEGGLRAAETLRCPALLVVAVRDLMAPPKAAQALIETLDSPRVVRLNDCGHAMMAEQPDAVLDALRSFC
ncbi:MAG TPA: alpha/beta hydrolase [Casimicrobiaceae bacterium]|nr:alpha/beta hydrolase [Casimicrobiaceae bacterium]